MGDNKISEAAVAWYVFADTENWVTMDEDEAEENREEGCQVRPLVFGDMGGHLQGEAVPVAYIVPSARVCHDGSMEDGPDSLCFADEADDYVKRVGAPLYTHPQPEELSERAVYQCPRCGTGMEVDPTAKPSAELNEVSGGSGELGEQHGDAPDPSVIVPTLRAMVRNYSDGHRWDHLDARMCRAAAGRIEMLEAALAATGKQQVGGFPWENFPAYLIDKCEGGTITEEGIQRAVADMAKDSRYATVQQVGEVQGSREQFEAWAKSNNYSSLKWPDGAYAEEAMQLAWKAWQHLASRQPVGAQGIDLGQLKVEVQRLRKRTDPVLGEKAMYVGLDAVLALLDGRDAGAGVNNGN